MRVEVTGAGGFIGRRVWKRLLTAGHTAIRSDVDLLCDPNKSEPWKGADAVIHCAGFVGGIMLNRESPAELMDGNLRMLMNALVIANKSGVKRFVNIGSVCSYPDIRRIDARLQPIEIWDGRPEASNAPYGIAKRVGLELVDAYRSQYGMIGNNLILSNVYGPGVHGGRNSHVIPALIKKFLYAIDNDLNEVIVWGNGSAVREFLYVDDAARAIVQIGLENDLPEPINVGSGSVVSIRELVTILCQLTGFKGDIRWDESKPDSQSIRHIDSSHARKFGFIPSTALEDGLKKIIEWANSERNSRTPATV